MPVSIYSYLCRISKTRFAAKRKGENDKHGTVRTVVLYGVRTVRKNDRDTPAKRQEMDGTRADDSTRESDARFLKEGNIVATVERVYSSYIQ